MLSVEVSADQDAGQNYQHDFTDSEWLYLVIFPTEESGRT